MVEFSTSDVTAQEGGDAPGRVMSLSEADDFEVADGYPEVRGWDVQDSVGRSIGYVYDLLVDVDALRVRYLDVELEPELAGSDADRRVRIPLESVSLDGSREAVLLQGVDAVDAQSLVPYARRGVVGEHETPRAAAPGLADVAASPPIGVEAEMPRERHYDDERLFARESASTSPDVGVSAESEPTAPIETERSLESVAERPAAAPALSAGELALGDVTLRKTVETERARERVTVEREEIEIERRALQPGEDLRVADVQGDEIRIPLMAEQLVVGKRVVTKEVLVIRKRRVTEERTVEEDVRREQVSVDDPLGRVRTLGETAGGSEGRA
jgi:photosynthetic reaction center H subunit